MKNLPSDLLLSTHRCYGRQRNDMEGPATSMDQSPLKTRTTRPAKTAKPLAEWNNYWCHHYSSWYTLLFLVIWKSPLQFEYCVDEDLLRSFPLTPSIREYRKDTLQAEVMNVPNCYFLRFRHVSVLFSSPNTGRLPLCSIRLLLESLAELSHP